LTTDAANSIYDLHNRMPLVLDAQGVDEWLGGGKPVLAKGINANNITLGMVLGKV